ncbi:hypothetical protein G5V57_02180 [Nordella sp. HKS 07]|uniref:hypothetical protein n=1 Tax=Nordella sp. HKS 07 TaxID=2712222 RepID=UPI0013E14B51|nr:hypothetical protein [Nordella sp. HKS 07]QIG46669.1 hypothetical protein G5V57_02180 [Nordella sp. HKS 07]
MWMPLHEAVARAGTLEALLPHLSTGRILACAVGFYTSEGSPVQQKDRRIPASWWGNAHDIDPPTGRAYFSMGLAAIDDKVVTYDILVIGIKFERAAVDALWSVKPKAPGRKRGVKPSPIWQQIFRHFDPVVDCDGRFPSVYSAASTVEAWLKKNNKNLSRSAIERGISKYRPDWITA